MRTTLLLVFISFTSLINAQDYHYWSEHFGARASLLGGAGTAGLGDNATVYYNTAAMAFVEDPSLSISVNAYRFRALKIPNALGEGYNLEETQFSTMPNLIAGILPFDKHPKLRLGYAVLTRRSFNQKFDFLSEENIEIIPQFTGDERFVYSYNLHHQIMEYWAGLGLSYQLTDNFSIGISHFGIYRDVKYSNAAAISILPQDFSGLEIYQIQSDQSFNYYNVKGLFKASLGLSVENFKFGISFTTPSFNMFGKGQAYRDISYINIVDIVPEVGIDIQVIDRVEGFKVVHKETGSLAFGVSWKLGKKAWLHFSNETYFGGKNYYLFDIDEKPSVYPDVYPIDTLENLILGGQNFLSLSEETEAVTNIGIGLESKIAKRWGLYLGARTDFRYNQYELNESVMRVESSKWHLVHFSLGLMHLTKKNKRYTVGLEYGTAPQSMSSNENKVETNSFKFILEIEVGKPIVDQ